MNTIIFNFTFLIFNLFIPFLHSQVPEWAREAVWYQIFPERFRNGDPANDPKVSDIIGAWPFDDSTEIRTMPWTSDWYALQPWEENGKGFYYHAQRRRYGGDLQGVLDKLDYLQELGINGIYFNPLFESPSLHKYDAACYHHIDDNFGPDPAGDKKIVILETPDDPVTWQWSAADRLFLTLLGECHRRGIRVIIDGVFNHVGLNFFGFVDLKKHQAESRYADWFTVTQWDDPATNADEFDYRCWYNVRTLPEIREDEHGFHEDAWKYMEASIRRWMDPNGDGDPADGIDGWRLDVAEQVTDASWRKFRCLVRSINPDAYIVAEIWWEKWPHKMYNAAHWLQGDMFDAVMNYRFAEPTIKFFVNRKKKMPVTVFDAVLSQLRNDYPEENNFVQQNLMDSHDTDRLASMIMNPDRGYGSANRLEDNRKYLIRKPNNHERKIQKLIVLFQMTYPGAPMIYYGDEVGMWGASDPDCRKSMLWDDLSHDDETSHPFGKRRPRDSVEFDCDLFIYHSKLIHIRRDTPALTNGRFETLLTDDRKSVYAFKREFGESQAVIIINNSEKPQEIVLQLNGDLWRDAQTAALVPATDGKVTLYLKGKEGKLLIH